MLSIECFFRFPEFEFYLEHEFGSCMHCVYNVAFGERGSIMVYKGCTEKLECL